MTKKNSILEHGIYLYSQMTKRMDDAIKEMNTARSQGAGFKNNAAAYKRATALAALYIDTYKEYVKHNATHDLNQKSYGSTIELDGARRLKNGLTAASKQIKLNSLHISWLKWIAKKFDNVVGDPNQKNYYTKLENAIKALEVGPPAGIGIRVPQSYAATMLRSAKETMKKGSNYSEKQEVSPDMVGLHLSDAADYMKIAEYLYDGKHLRAANYATMMDTASRESIPEKVWQYLEI